jgi:hypothetical protein
VGKSAVPQSPFFRLMGPVTITSQHLHADVVDPVINKQLEIDVIRPRIPNYVLNFSAPGPISGVEKPDIWCHDS